MKRFRTRQLVCDPFAQTERVVLTTLSPIASPSPRLFPFWAAISFSMRRSGRSKLEESTAPGAVAL